MRRNLASAAVLALGALALTACAPVEEASDPAAAPSAPADDLDPADCVTDEMLLEPGVLTVGTDSPAYDPWFVGNDPTNGEGYESAVAYEVADRLGFSEDQVTWVKVPFNTSYAPGAKEFDLDINQISITPKRAEVVDFSEGYYQAAQAVIALDGTAGAEATSLADLADLRLGAQTGTTRPRRTRPFSRTPTPRSRRWSTTRSTRSWPTCPPRSTSPPWRSRTA